MTNREQRLSALSAFKDWSNYLLVTTVAALGWTAADEKTHLPRHFKVPVIWCLAASTFFAILTLAMIPVIGEGVSDGVSIYDTGERVRGLYLWRGWMTPRLTLKMFCWPQHVLFLVGIALYAWGAASWPTVPVWLHSLAHALFD